MRQSQQYSPSTDARRTQYCELSARPQTKDHVASTADHEMPKNTAAHKEDWRTIRLLQLIDADPLASPETLALNFHVSRSRLQRLIKRATGLGLMKIVNDKRLHKAAHLLTQTHMGIKEIASVAGYEHNSSFTRAFVKHFGCGPRHYRMEHSLSQVLVRGNHK